MIPTTQDRILIVIPTLDRAEAEKTAHLAILTAGCDAEVFVSVDKDRRGFSKTVNRGMRRANGADVMILNDDLRWFTYGWLATMSRALYNRSCYGIAGPSGKSSTSPMRNGYPGMSGLAEVNHVPFWCALVKAETIRRIGILDEAFIHYGSDNWYCHVAKQAGLVCVWVRDVYIKHDHHGSGLITEWKEHDDQILGQRFR